MIIPGGCQTNAFNENPNLLCPEDRFSCDNAHDNGHDGDNGHDNEDLDAGNEFVSNLQCLWVPFAKIYMRLP